MTWYTGRVCPRGHGAARARRHELHALFAFRVSFLYNVETLNGKDGYA